MNENVTPEATLELVRDYIDREMLKVNASSGEIYHAKRLLEAVNDEQGMTDLLAGEIEADELESPEERISSVHLYLENQGDKFHPHSDELLKLVRDH